MENIILESYLFFDGNCRQAMEFYKSIFGGQLDIVTYEKVPGTKPENKDKVIHANLRSADLHIMASDSGTGPVAGVARVQLSLSGSDEPKLRKIFDQLSEGGKVRSPLQKAFWGDLHGALSDKFGIDWMMTIGSKEA